MGEGGGRKDTDVMCRYQVWIKKGSEGEKGREDVGKEQYMEKGGNMGGREIERKAGRQGKA